MSLWCIVPAAGLSRRFGPADKLLAPFGSGRSPLVRYALAAAVAANSIDGVVLVVREGEAGEAVTAAVADLMALKPVLLVRVAEQGGGLGRSIAAGARAVPAAVSGAMVLPADMPNVTPAWLEQLAGSFAEHGKASIIVPMTAAGEQRNPVIWPADLVAELAALGGEPGGKGLIALYQERVVRVPASDEALFRDIDVPADLDL
ncbi:MAG: NTP transferase domain-containing protein [Hyphomicrobiaceae bacterium]|nr:NTP transferase domain-containing protein [Hyphomicrobiaceae bacterium]